MRYWHYCRGLLSCTVFLGFATCMALAGCGGFNTDTTPKATVNGTLNLTDTNTAALGGLTFNFPDATIFGFSSQSATLAWGSDGTTFTLTTSNGTAITGNITFGSCTFTQNPAPSGGTSPFTATYDTCQVNGKSNDDIPFGGAGDGTITLILGRANQTPVFSDQAKVTYSVTTGGQILINANTTPIGTTG